VNLLASGFHQVPGKFELAVKLTRVMFAFLLLVALAAQAMGVLNACNRFAVPALASTFFNIGSVTFGLLLGYVLGPHLGLEPITGMAIGVVLGGLQLACNCRRCGPKGSASIRPSTGTIRCCARSSASWVPPSSATQPSKSTCWSSPTSPRGFRQRPVSWLGYSFRFMQLPLGLFGVAIASATLPSISRSAGLAISTNSAAHSPIARMVFLFTLPSAVGLIVLGRTMIGAIYQGGKFSAYDTEQTAIALLLCCRLAGYSALKVLNPAFYALHDARTPMLVSLLSIAINYFTASMLFRHTGWGTLASRSLPRGSHVRRRCAVGDSPQPGRCIYGRNLIESVWKSS